LEAVYQKEERRFDEELRIEQGELKERRQAGLARLKELVRTSSRPTKDE
jgi:hypothetical protein